MPQGSSPGERRGGRQKGTPNRRAKARAAIMKHLEDMAKPEPLSQHEADGRQTRPLRLETPRPTMQTDPPLPDEW